MYFKLICLCIFDSFFPLFNWIMFKLCIYDKNKFYRNFKYIIKINGPVYIKYTQLLLVKKQYLLHCYNTLFDEELINILSEFENDIYLPHEKKTVIINNQSYNIIDSYSITSGSMAYIYEVNYKGKICILKSVHHNIRQNIKISFQLLKIHLWLLSCFKRINAISQIMDIHQYEDLLLKQTSMNHESKNLKLFGRLFLKYDMIHVPIHVNHTNTDLIMSKESGMKLSVFLKLYPKLTDEVFYLLYSVIHIMISNLILHGDFHQGNFFFKRTNNKVHITIFDFGIIYKVSKKQSEILLNYIEHFRDKYLIQFVNTFDNNIDENITPAIVRSKTQKDKFYDVSLINFLMSEYNVKLPVEILNLLTTIDFLKIINSKYGCRRKKDEFLVQLGEYMVDNDLID